MHICVWVLKVLYLLAVWLRELLLYTPLSIHSREKRSRLLFIFILKIKGDVQKNLFKALQKAYLSSQSQWACV